MDDSDGKFRYRIMKVICDSSNKTVFNNVSCPYRTYKGGTSLVSLRGTIFRKSTNPLLTHVSKRQNSDGYQTIMEFKEIEICKLLKNIDNAPIPFIGNFMNYLKNGAFTEGNILDYRCGNIGELNFFNLSLLKFSPLDLFPEGDYILQFHVFDDFDSQIMNLTIFSHLTKF